MPRTLPTGLAEALKRGRLETHSTLELTLPNSATGGETRYYATARLTVNGVLHTAQLRDTSAIKQSLTRAADRATVDLQNVDTVLDVELASASEAFYGSRVRFGRYWRDLDSGAVFHKYLLTGAVVGVTINENVAQLQLVSDAYAALNVGAIQPVVRNCRWEVVGGFRGAQCGYSGDKLTCNYLLDHADGCEGRHGSPLKRARFGGYAYIKSQATVSGAAGLAAPASAQLVRSSDGVTTTSYLQQSATTFLGAEVTTDPVNDENIVNLTSAGRRYAIHAVTDYLATGDGTTDDTTAIQNAIDAAELGGRSLYLPAGEYYVPGGLVIAGNVTLFGDGDKLTILTSDANTPIVELQQASFEFPVVENLKIRGDVTAGSGQIGLKADDALYGLRCAVRNVYIENCGGAGLYVGKAFSSLFENVFSSNCAGGNYIINAPNMPALTFRHCDSGVIHSSYRTGYHIQAGSIVMRDCNSIYGGSNPEWCVTVGKCVGRYGETAQNNGAFVRFENCNFESSTVGGVELLYNSRASFHNCAWVGDGGSSGTYKAILSDICQIEPTETTGTINNGSSSLVVANAATWTIGQGIKIAGAGVASADLSTTISNIVGTTFTLAAPASTSVVGAVVSHTDEVFYAATQGKLGVIDDDCTFSNGPDSFYANSEPVHITSYPSNAGAATIPLLATNGRGPKISQGSYVSRFYNDTTSKTWPLPRFDGFLPVQRITASTTYTGPGVRYIECDHSAPITVTLPWPGWQLNTSNELIIVKDVSSAGAGANNVTISASSGGTVNGGSYTLDADGASVVLVPHSADDYRVVATYAPGGSVTGSGVAGRFAYWSGTSALTSDGDASFDGFNATFGRVYHSGGSAGAPGVAPSGDVGTGFYLASTGVYGFASSAANGGSGGNVVSLRGTGVDIDGYLTLAEKSAPSTPSANFLTLYAKDKAGVSALYYKDDGGTEHDLSASGGSGDVVGPSSSTDNALARFDSTTGKIIQNSGVTLSDLATNTYTLAAVAPAVAGTSTAGIHFITRATDAVAGNVTNGAAAGGDYYVIAGDAKRLNTGNANGGNLYLTAGAAIGSGTDGQIVIGRNGTGAVPAIAWAGALNSGISSFSSGIQFTYAGSNNAAITANGAKFSTNGRVAWSSDTTTFGTEDLSIWRHAANVARVGGDNTGAVAGKLFVSRSDKTHVGWFTVDGDTANTNAVADVGAIGLDSTGTAAAGLGAQLQFTLESSTTNQQQAAGLTWLWTTATHASRTADLYFSTVQSGSVAEAFRILGSGAFRSVAMTDPASPNNGDIWNSLSRNCYSVRQSGQTEDLSTTMWRSSAQSSFDTSSSATSIIADTGVGTKTLAADRAKVGNQIRMTAGGVYGTKASSAGTLTLRVRNGGVTMLTSVFTLPDGVTDQAWSVEAVGAVNATGSSGVIYWRLTWLMTDASGIAYMTNYTVNSTTINTTTSRALDVTAQFSVSDADNFVQTDNAAIELLS